MKRSMIVGALALLLMCASALAHKDRIEHGRTVSIDFKTGEKVVFEVTNSAIAAITVQIGASRYSVPQEVCLRLRPREIHFDTVKLLWNGSFKTAAEANYFHIQFMMGPVSTKPYAEFPPVSVHFHDGKFSRVHGLPN